MTDITDQAQSRGHDVPAGWGGILDAGERILWQGRPDQGFHLEITRLPLAVFGLFFAGFALFWMVMAAQAGGVFWMFGLLHFSVGVGLAFSALAWGTLKRRATWYTLTDRRAFIATRLPLRGKRLDSYTITPDTRLSLRDGSPGSVLFGREERRGNKGRVYTVDIGFERIDDAGSAFEILRDIQRRAEQEAKA
jgi:hypothetical protein